MCITYRARVREEIHSYQPDICSAEKQQDDEPVDSGELVEGVLITIMTMMMMILLYYYILRNVRRLIARVRTGWTKKKNVFRRNIS